MDDFIIIHENKEFLKTLIPALSNFLLSTLKLTLHPNKIYLHHFSKGVKFLGAVIKPNRIYISNRTKGNFYEAIQHHNAIARMHKPDKEEQVAFLSCINSYLGILKPAKATQLGQYYKTYKLRQTMIKRYLSAWWWNLFSLSGGCEKFISKSRRVKNTFHLPAP